ncbi:MAG: hypothetical protein AB1564_07050 [Chloroflexota bacterium]
MRLFYGRALLLALLLVSCQPILPQSSLRLTVIVDRESFGSFEDVSAKVILENVGNESLLVNGRLLFRTEPYFPPEGIEGLFLITDAEGKSVIVDGKIDHGFPIDEFFIVLSPGQYIEKIVTLHGLGFIPQEFRNNELYTVVAYYQNSLDVTRIIDGKEIVAWKGKIQSNTVTFQISP